MMSSEQMPDIPEVRAVIGRPTSKSDTAHLVELAISDDPAAYETALQLAERNGFDLGSLQAGETFRISVFEEQNCRRSPLRRRAVATHYLFTLFLTAGQDSHIGEASDETLDALANEPWAIAQERLEAYLAQQGEGQLSA